MIDMDLDEINLATDKEGTSARRARAARKNMKKSANNLKTSRYLAQLYGSRRRRPRPVTLPKLKCLEE